MRKPKYPPEVEAFVAAHVKGTPMKELARMTNEALGTDFTQSSMKAYCSNHKLKNGRPYIPHYDQRIFSPEEEDFIRSHIVGTNPQAMADLILQHFAHSVTPKQVKAYYSRNHLKTGIDSRFQKGVPSYNKGKKQSEFLSPEGIERSKKTRFQKGNQPHNLQPIGHERIKNVDGFVLVKVGNFEDPTKNYRLKHRVVWEEQYGPIPPGMVLRFLDGDKTNCSIENLQLITREEHMEMVRKGFAFREPELTKAAIGIAKLNCAVYGRKKH